MKKWIMGLVALSAAYLQAAELPLDKDHSAFTFSIPHMGIARVPGRFSEFDGSLRVEEGELKGAKVVVQVASIDTAVEQRDEHLRSGDFFDAEEYPTMTFESTRIEGDRLIGELTIRDVTREVAFEYNFHGPITDPWGNTRYGLTAATTLNRTDFGVTWDQTLDTGELVVGREVKVKVNLEAVAGE